MNDSEIFRVTVEPIILTAKRAAGAKRPLITKLPTTLENPINLIKETVREIRKDDPAKPRGVDTVADTKQMSRGCEGRDIQEEGQPVKDRERQERDLFLTLALFEPIAIIVIWI